MPLELPEPPPEVPAIISDRVQLYSVPGTPNPAALGGSDPGALTLSTPHETYVIGLDDLQAADPLDVARPTGWRYLLEAGGVAVASAETNETSPGKHRFALFNSGPFVASTVETLSTANELPQVEDQEMQIRLLNVPGLNMVALWLHGQREDILLPLDPAPAGVEPGRAYAAGELFEILREPARQLADIGPSDEVGS